MYQAQSCAPAQERVAAGAARGGVGGHAEHVRLPARLAATIPHVSAAVHSAVGMLPGLSYYAVPRHCQPRKQPAMSLPTQLYPHIPPSQAQCTYLALPGSTSAHTRNRQVVWHGSIEQAHLHAHQRRLAQHVAEAVEQHAARRCAVTSSSACTSRPTHLINLFIHIIAFSLSSLPPLI